MAFPRLSLLLVVATVCTIAHAALHQPLGRRAALHTVTAALPLGVITSAWAKNPQEAVLKGMSTYLAPAPPDRPVEIKEAAPLTEKQRIFQEIVGKEIAKKEKSLGFQLDEKEIAELTEIYRLKYPQYGCKSLSCAGSST